MATTEHSHKHRFARLISWTMLGLTLAGFAGTVVLQWLGCGILFDPSRSEPASAYGLAMVPLNGLAFALLGTLIITYRPDNRFGWLANLYGVALTWTNFDNGHGQCAIEGTTALAGGEYAVWLNNVLTNVAFMALALMPWLFPDDRFLIARWRRVGLVGIALVLVFTVLRAIWLAPLPVDPLGRRWIDNPFSLPVPDLPWLDALMAGPNNLIILMFLAGIVSLVLRWLRSSGEPRQQIKWLAFFFATASTLFLAIEVLGAGFYPAIFDGWFHLLVLLPFWLGLPVVMGLAIFKYRLYDIDVVIRKTLLYAVLTALLALVYFGVVVLLQGLFSRLAGVEQSTLALVISTLAIAALSTLLRCRIQTWSDRRLFRKKCNAQPVLAQCALTARDETENRLFFVTPFVTFSGRFLATLALNGGKMASIRDRCRRNKTAGPSELAPDVPAAEAAPQAVVQLGLDIAATDPLLAYLQGSGAALDLSRLSLDSPALGQMGQSSVAMIAPLWS